jgi:hypothetical protein
VTIGILPFAGNGVVFGRNQMGLNGISYFSGIHPIANWCKNGNTQQFIVTCAGAVTSLTAALPTGTTTVATGSFIPAVFTVAGHNLYPGAPVTLTTTGTLPAPFSSATTYFVADYAFTANTFSLALTVTNPIVATTAGSGTHTFTSVWSGYGTLSGSCGLLQVDTTGGVGVPYQNSFWPMGLTCTGNSAYNKGTPGSPVFAYGLIDNTHFAYPLAANSNPGASSGTITWGYTVNESVGQSSPGSARGLNGDPFIFLDANRDLKPNAFPLATQVIYFRIVDGLDTAHGAIAPPGYTRNGETFCTAYTPLGGSPIVSNFTFVNFGQNLNFSYTMGTGATTGLSSMATPPRDMYYGSRNLYDGNNGMNWLNAYGTSASPGPGGAGLFEPAYLAMLQNTCGCIRFMDWQITAVGASTQLAAFNYAALPSMSYAFWGNTNAADGLPYGLPLQVLTSLANAVNKHPWINIPAGYKGGKQAKGQFFSQGSPTVVTTLSKHNFVNGDTVILYSVGGNGIGSGDQAGWGVNASVTINVGTGVITYTGHGLLVGQPVVPAGGTLPTGFTSNQTYYVCNDGNLTANTFRVSTTYANAIAGTPQNFSGSASSVTINVAVQRLAFKVGAVTDTTMVLSNLSSVNFVGTYPTSTFNIVSPYVQSEQETEVTSFMNEIKTRLNSNITPFFEFGNENWNSIFTSFSHQNALARNFCDTSGVSLVANSQNNMQGYQMAASAKITRDIFGGGATGTRPWKWRLGGQLGNSGVISAGLTGVKTYLTQNSSALLVADLVDDVTITSYTGVAVNTDASIGTVTFTAASPGTITGAAGQCYAGEAVVFSNSGGGMPTATNGLNPGLLSQQNAASPQVSITGTFTAGTLNVTVGSGIVAGMTVYGTQTAGVFMNSVVSCVIRPFGTTDPNTGLPSTGAGGTGTYVTDSVQTLSSRSLVAYDPTLNSIVYYLLGPTSPYQFTDAIANFNASVNTSGVMTVVSYNNRPQVALTTGMVVFQPINNNAINPTDISAGTVTITGILGGGQYQLSASPAVALPLQRMSAGLPINLSTAGTGTFTMRGARFSWVQQMMNQSKVNWTNDNVTYPSQYTYYNQQMGFENIYGQATATLILLYGQLVAQVTNVLATGEVGGGTLIPAVGLAPYEGGPGANPQNTAPNGTSTSAMGNWIEYGPQACGTAEEAAGVAALWSTCSTILGGTFNTATLPSVSNKTIPANFRITYLPKFVDAILPSSLFQFGSIYVIDSGNPNGFGSIGSPSIINGSGQLAYPGPWYNAMVATN